MWGRRDGAGRASWPVLAGKSFGLRSGPSRECGVAVFLAVALIETLSDFSEKSGAFSEKRMDKPGYRGVTWGLGDGVVGCLPYLKFYPGDWLSDRPVRMMSLEARGLYFDLLCVAWQEGSIPDPPLELAGWLRVPPKRFEKIWTAEVAGSWVHGAKGTLVNPRQEQERIKAESVYKQRVAAGRKGGRPQANGKRA